MEPQSATPLHERCGPEGVLGVDTECKDAHSTLIEGDTSGYPVSVAHADAAANQATAALRSLFGSSRLSSSAVLGEAEGEDQLVDAEVLAAHECVHDADKEWRGVAGPHHPTEQAGGGGGEAVEGGRESNGEEELLESAEAFADDMETEQKEGVDTAIAAEVVSRSQLIAAQKLESAERQRAANPVAMPYAEGEPVNLYGSRYWGSIAETLRSAAEARRFISPFWSSQRSFERIGATVTAEEKDGVLLHAFTPVPLRLFNLEQTSLAAEYRAATVQEFLAHVRLRGGHVTSSSRDGLSSVALPLDLAGGFISHERTRAIIHSPHFFQLQKQSRYWLSDREVRVIGATVRPEEIERYASVPIWNETPVHRNTANMAADAVLLGDACADTAAFSASDASVSTNPASSVMRWYNVAQLDDPQRFAQLDPVRDKLVRCFGFSGTRYRCCTTWLMWEYCARYHFPLTDTPRIVFLTMEMLFRLGGSVMLTKRYPISRKHADRGDGNAAGSSSTAFTGASNTPPPSAALSASEKVHLMPVCGGKGTGTCRGDNTRDSEDGTNTTAADAGVVPPLFIMEMRGEVVSLCNAMQTDIADLILARVDELRGNRFRLRRGQY